LSNKQTPARDIYMQRILVTGANKGIGLALVRAILERDSDTYGLSKACANSYTLCLAREHPSLSINACTPGWIDTDLTRYHAEASGKSPTELGMKPASQGTRSALHLLFEALEGNGRYYGSDAVRSPLDAYRAPGDPPFQG